MRIRDLSATLVCVRAASPQQLELVAESVKTQQCKPQRVPQLAGTASRVSSDRGLRANELLETPGALLNRSHLRDLGLERRAVDAVFRALPVVALPGYSRPMIRAEDYLELVRQSTLRGDRVRPTARP